VFTEQGIRLSGNDAYYHALRVERTLEGYPTVPKRDAWLSYPDGADIPWPPLFDGVVAAIGRARGGPEGGSAAALRAATWIPVFVGVSTVLMVAVLGKLLAAPAVGAVAAVMLALLPAHVTFSGVGDFDHHGAEVLLLVAALTGLAALPGAGPASRRARASEVMMAAALAASFLVWHGSVLHVAIVAGGFAASWMTMSGDPEGRTRLAASLARASLLAAGLLALGVGLLVSPLALTRFSLVGATGFHVVGLLLLGGFAAALAVPIRGDSGAWARPLWAAAACLALGLMVPAFRDPVAHGLTALTAGSPWHRNIQEFDPLLFAGYSPLRRELRTALDLTGLGLPLAPLSMWWMIRCWPDDPRQRAGAAGILWLGLALIPLAVARKRFLVYAAVPLSLWAAALVVGAARRVARRHGSILGGASALVLTLVVLSPTLGWHRRERGASGGSAEREALIEALEWLRARAPSRPGSPAVFAEWDFGHLIQYFARKPVLVSPFGTDVGDGPMADFARAFLATHADTFDAVLERRRVGFVVLSNPVTEAHFARGYLPPEAPEVVTATRDWRTGLRVRVNPPFWEIASSRLYFDDGTGRGGGEAAIPGLRLVFESRRTTTWQGRLASAFKVFERVAGARLEVRSAPGELVRAETLLLTDSGRRVRWATESLADPEGRAELSLPYATGVNGTVWSVPYRVTAGSRAAELRVTEAEVTASRALRVMLPPGG